MANLAQISSMIGPEFPPSPKEGAWLAVCVGVLRLDHLTRFNVDAILSLN